VPSGFFVNRGVQGFITKHTLPIAKFLDFLIPITHKDSFSRYAAYLERGELSQEENILDIMSKHPTDTIFTDLTVDMNGMGAGKTKVSYEEQLKEVIGLKRKGYPILVYYHLDPTIEGAYEMLLKYANYIDGLKVYTLMGHFPYHPTLIKAYKWCSDNNKPVTFHTSPSSPVHWKGSMKELDGRLKEAKFPLYPNKKTKSEKCSNFTNPQGYYYVAKLFPKVFFNFAHLAGEEEIMKHIKTGVSMTTLLLNIIAELDNCMFDTAFSFYDYRILNFLKQILSNSKWQRHCLYGSDIYMVLTKTTEKEYRQRLINALGVPLFMQIANVNSKKFRNGIV
jgi:predicted TIM-barrel fold metal-dependent hydrolase